MSSGVRPWGVGLLKEEPLGSEEVVAPRKGPQSVAVLPEAQTNLTPRKQATFLKIFLALSAGDPGQGS